MLIMLLCSGTDPLAVALRHHIARRRRQPQVFDAKEIAVFTRVILWETRQVILSHSESFCINFSKSLDRMKDTRSTVRRWTGDWCRPERCSESYKKQHRRWLQKAICLPNSAYICLHDSNHLLTAFLFKSVRHLITLITLLFMSLLFFFSKTLRHLVWSAASASIC